MPFEGGYHEPTTSINPQLQKIRLLLAEIAANANQPGNLERLKPELKKLILETHPDRHPGNDQMLEVAKLVSTLVEGLKRPDQFSWKNQRQVSKRLEELETLARTAKTPPKQEPEEIPLDESDVEFVEEPRAKKKGRGRHEQEHLRTEYGFIPTDAEDTAKFFEGVFSYLSEKNRDFGNAYTIQHKLDEYCADIAQAWGSKRDLVHTLQPIKVTRGYDNTSGIEYEGQDIGEVLFMGEQIGSWSSDEEGYAFHVGQFDRPAFLRAYHQYVDQIKNRKE